MIDPRIGLDCRGAKRRYSYWLPCGKAPGRGTRRMACGAVHLRRDWHLGWHLGRAGQLLGKASTGSAAFGGIAARIGGCERASHLGISHNNGIVTACD